MTDFDHGRISLLQMATENDRHILLKILGIIFPIWFTFILFVLCILFVFVPSLKQNMMVQKKETIKKLVDSSYSLFAEYHNKVEKGELTLSEAQKRAIDQIRNLRYGPEGKDYFWVNDMHPFMIMHPYRPDLERRDLTLFKDSEGNYPFVAMVQIIMQKGSGYVSYSWQWKDTPQKTGPKISYVKGFAPWGWIIGTGIYTEDVESEIDLILKNLSAISIIVLMTILGISLYLSFRIARSEKERIQSLDMLRKSEEMHRKFIDNAPVGMFSQNLNAEFTYINKKLESITGYKKKNWLNKSLIPIVHPDDVKIVQHKRILRIEGKGSTDPYEIRIFNSNQEIIWVKINSESIFAEEDGSKKLIGMQSFVEDITQQKETESALRANEGRLKAILEANPDPMVAYDLNGYPQYLNPAFTTVFGWSLTELEGKMIPFVPEDQKKITSEKIKEIFEHRKSLSFETKRYTKNNKCLDVLISAVVNENDEGNPIGMVANLTDITDRNALEIQHKQIQKMESIGTLAGGIAHDFNNILFPILGYSEMLLDDVPIDSPTHNSLKKIHTGALRAKNLVKQILTFSRQEKSDLKLMKIQPIIKEALKFIRSTIPTTIGIEQEFQADSVVVKADPTQIHQVIMNLATNAYHAMEKTGGELTVSLKEIELGEDDVINPDMTPGDYACLKVADTGIGMDKNLIKKVFDPFFTTKEKGKGTGMGLSVVHGIVTGMGGAIQIYSEPGRGTQFSVYLPAEKKSSAEQKGQVKQPMQGGSEHILLVDDEDAIITMEKQMLERLGYKVTSRTSSIEALEAFRDDPDKFDLIITDMAMPNLSGDKLAVELIKIRNDIPILLCTGFSENMSQGKVASLGIKDFLLKPIVMKDLAQKMREVLDRDEN